MSRRKSTRDSRLETFISFVCTSQGARTKHLHFLRAFLQSFKDFIDNRLIFFTSFVSITGQNVSVQVLVCHHVVFHPHFHRLSCRLFLLRMVCPVVSSGSMLSWLFRDNEFSVKSDTVSFILHQEYAGGQRIMWITVLMYT
ncbi:hypothetical protein NPIL_97281 [Nephila pilipes]|uniref:Uncharacterized protein n=1 Tax=Nephila pilipes TaxID=299642 RepID=A0A8X6NKC4_NEPPI|nr:hypothetical protein NPIL_97281 [Nephila pilipes]